MQLAMNVCCRKQTGERSNRAFTLAEVLIAMGISVLMISGIVYGYLMSANRAEWSGYSLAAQSLVLQKIEQTRACQWDPEANPPIDELLSTNFLVETQVLDIPISKTNVVYATNYTTIFTVSTNPPVKCIRVDCVWRFLRRGLFTNTALNYRAPDN